MISNNILFSLFFKINKNSLSSNSIVDYYNLIRYLRNEQLSIFFYWNSKEYVDMRSILFIFDYRTFKNKSHHEI